MVAAIQTEFQEDNEKHRDTHFACARSPEIGTGRGVMLAWMKTAVDAGRAKECLIGE
jgi:hypothetical protein